MSCSVVSWTSKAFHGVDLRAIVSQRLHYIVAAISADVALKVPLKATNLVVSVFTYEFIEHIDLAITQLCNLTTSSQAEIALILPYVRDWAINGI